MLRLTLTSLSLTITFWRHSEFLVTKRMEKLECQIPKAKVKGIGKQLLQQTGEEGAKLPPTGLRLPNFSNRSMHNFLLVKILF